MLKKKLKKPNISYPLLRAIRMIVYFINRIIIMNYRFIILMKNAKMNAVLNQEIILKKKQFLNWNLVFDHAKKN